MLQLAVFSNSDRIVLETPAACTRACMDHTNTQGTFWSLHRMISKAPASTPITVNSEMPYRGFGRLTGYSLRLLVVIPQLNNIQQFLAEMGLVLPQFCGPGLEFYKWSWCQRRRWNATQKSEQNSCRGSGFQWYLELLLTRVPSYPVRVIARGFGFMSFSFSVLLSVLGNEFFFPTGTSTWLLLLSNKQECFMWLYDPIMITYYVFDTLEKIKIQSSDYNWFLKTSLVLPVKSILQN